jgi:SRSO17 transposase
VRPARQARRIVAQRQWGRRQPFALWITNLSPAQLPDVVKLVRLHEQVRGELAELEQAAGLQHFEGRSFRGWHHHVTLASVAHAYRVLSADRADPRRTLRAVGR